MVGTPSSLRTGPACRSAGWNTGAMKKPSPTSARQRRTSSGDRSIRTPRASSTSAAPDFDDALRLPCLATGTPAAAVTIVAIVEMFTEFDRSPPVPTMSTA